MSTTRPTTPKINLLPYRAERKKEIAKRFQTFLGIAAGAAVGIMVLIHVGHSMIKSNQETRNAYIDGQNQLLDKEIAEIGRLKDDIAAMISRKQVVEGLQANRPRTVMLLNYIANPPEGVFYREVSQKGDTVTLRGYALSNTAVSALIRQIESSGVLVGPKLLETKKTTVGGKSGMEMMDFGITAQLINLSAIALEQKNVDARNKASQAVRDALEQNRKSGETLPEADPAAEQPASAEAKAAAPAGNEPTPEPAAQPENSASPAPAQPAAAAPSPSAEPKNP